jgi:hypothetical protein
MISVLCFIVYILEIELVILIECLTRILF